MPSRLRDSTFRVPSYCLIGGAVFLAVACGTGPGASQNRARSVPPTTRVSPPQALASVTSPSARVGEVALVSSPASEGSLSSNDASGAKAGSGMAIGGCFLGDPTCHNRQLGQVPIACERRLEQPGEAVRGGQVVATRLVAPVGEETARVAFASRYLSLVRTCYEEGLVEFPNIRGMLAARITEVPSEPCAQTATVLRTQGLDPVTQGCVIAVLKKAFLASGVPDATIELTFEPSAFRAPPEPVVHNEFWVRRSCYPTGCKEERIRSVQLQVLSSRTSLRAEQLESFLGLARIQYHIERCWEHSAPQANGQFLVRLTISKSGTLDVLSLNGVPDQKLYACVDKAVTGLPFPSGNEQTTVAVKAQLVAP